MKNLGKLVSIGAAMAIVVVAFVYTAGWISPERLTRSKLMGAIQEGNGGIHAGFRRAHAKGMCFTGIFESSGAAVPFSKAAVFQPGRVPFVGRFALAVGMPFAPDKPDAVRSMALRFMPANGEEWRTGINGMPVFVANSAEGFYELLAASKPDPASGKPNPEAMGAFAGRHPEFVHAIDLIKAAPHATGFADTTFNSLNAFRFVNANGESAAVRWPAVPLQPAVVQAHSPDDDASAPPKENALFDDLIAQVHEKPLRWQLVVTLAEPGDQTVDPTMAWPLGRRHIDAGVLTVDRVSSEDGGPCKDINYDPLVLPPGIEPSDDPILSARSAAYALSHRRREAEHAQKQPSAVTPAETQRVVKP